MASTSLHTECSPPYLGLDKCSGAEIDDREAAVGEIEEEVLVFDVSVSDTPPVTGNYCAHNLAEKLPGQLFAQSSLVCDEIKQILAGLWSLQDVDERILPLEEIVESDDSWHALNFV